VPVFEPPFPVVEPPLPVVGDPVIPLLMLPWQPPAPSRAAAVRRPKRGKVLIAPPISRASVSHFEMALLDNF
jgi:hypothetical protein